MTASDATGFSDHEGWQECANYKSELGGGKAPATATAKKRDYVAACETPLANHVNSFFQELVNKTHTSRKMPCHFGKTGKIFVLMIRTH